MSVVKRSEGSHWYEKGGAPKHEADLRVARKELLYPSVTTIDKAVFKNEFLEKWMQDQILIAAGDSPRQPHENGKQYAQRIYDLSMEKSRNAMDFGKKIHDACEHYPDPCDPELAHWHGEFDKWWTAKPRKVVSKEIVLLDHDIGVAGRTDLIYDLDGEGLFLRTIADYKTQDVKVDDKGRKKPTFYDSWLRQLAFYAAAHAKEAGTWPIMPNCENIIIDSNPGGLIYTKTYFQYDVLDAYRRFIHGAWLWFDDRGYWPNGLWYPNSKSTDRAVELPLYL